MKNKWIILVVLFFVAVVAAVLLIIIPAPEKTGTTGTINTTSTSASIPELITVTSPLPNTIITSPLNISGQARGNWFFEASAPYQLTDSSGAVIAEGHVDTQGDWMTTDFVPFVATVTFPPQPVGSKGTLILKNDNPSGDPAKDKELDIPVVF